MTSESKSIIKVQSSVIRHSLNLNLHFTASDNVNRKLKILSLSLVTRPIPKIYL